MTAQAKFCVRYWAGENCRPTLDFMRFDSLAEAEPRRLEIAFAERACAADIVPANNPSYERAIITRDQFSAFVHTATLAQALAAYKDCRITLSQLTAFENAWSLGSPRFGKDGERFRARVHAAIQIACEEDGVYPPEGGAS